MGHKRDDLCIFPFAIKRKEWFPLSRSLKHIGKNGQGEMVSIFDLVDGGNPPQDGKDARSPGSRLAPKAEPPRQT